MRVAAAEAVASGKEHGHAVRAVGTGAVSWQHRHQSWHASSRSLAVCRGVQLPRSCTCVRIQLSSRCSGCHATVAKVTSTGCCTGVGLPSADAFGIALWAGELHGACEGWPSCGPNPRRGAAKASIFVGLTRLRRGPLAGRGSGRGQRAGFFPAHAAVSCHAAGSARAPSWTGPVLWRASAVCSSPGHGDLRESREGGDSGPWSCASAGQGRVDKRYHWGLSNRRPKSLTRRADEPPLCRVCRACGRFHGIEGQIPAASKCRHRSPPAVCDSNRVQRHGPAGGAATHHGWGRASAWPCLSHRITNANDRRTTIAHKPNVPGCHSRRGRANVKLSCTLAMRSGACL
mmetsp:Transcript_72921/g.170834  ORF Transcript_72921/g.170834 Transcript_72921/m.170834 type:complete len:345 (+) Transcript_72921:1099-2133(+)